MRTTEFDFAGTEKAAKNKRRKRVVVVSAVAAVVLLPIAAYAAVLLFGFGTFEASAATPGTLTVQPGTAKTTKTLAPGQTVGVKGNVTNGNDYPVTVTGIIVENASVQVTGGSAAECKVSFAGGTATPFPNADGTFQAAGTGTLFAVSPGVDIPASNTKEIKVDDVIKQDASATKLCGVKANFAVRGQVGS